jgi:hypothetical protein
MKNPAVARDFSFAWNLVAWGGIGHLMILRPQAASKSNLVAWGGIEPPTHGFSVRCSTN